MNEITVGCALREHRTHGEPKLFGRVIHIDKLIDLVVIVRIPGKNKKGHQKNYVRRPLHEHLSALKRQVAAKEFSVVEFDTPTHWLLTSEQLRQNSTSGLLDSSRRDLTRWILRRRNA